MASTLTHQMNKTIYMMMRWCMGSQRPYSSLDFTQIEDIRDLL